MKRFGMHKERQRIHTSIAPMAGLDKYGVHSNSLPNLERAIVERVFTVNGGLLPPQPQGNTLRRRLNRFAARLVCHVDKVEQLSTEDFVASYTGRKRAMYQRAVDDLDINPLTPKDAIVQAFIKDEKVNLSRKADPCPRIIQPRTPRFNVAIGVYLKPLEKAIFRGIAGVFRGVTVLKGYNAVERATILREKWDQFSRPCAIMLDASRFDQHVSRDLLDWESSVYRRLLLDPRGFERVNKLRSKNVVYARAQGGGFKYETRGCRMSGDMDTALGNCLSMCAMTWSFMRSIGVEFAYANDGDDGIIIVEEKWRDTVLERFHDYFLTFGFTMKLEGVASVFEHMEFCQSRPVWANDHWRMVRSPDIALMKDSITLRRADTRFLANVVGWGGLALAGTIPVCGAYYRAMINDEYVRDPEAPSCGRDFLAERLEPIYAEPNDESRLSFYLAFGLSPDVQLALEQYCNSTTFSHITPTLVRFVAGDAAYKWWSDPEKRT